MAGETYNTKTPTLQGGDTKVFKSGSKLLMETGSIFEKESGVTETGNKVYLTGEIADISSAASSWVVSPVAGTITKIYSVIDGTITTADAVLTFEIGGVAVTNGTVTIDDSGSAAGIVDSATPTATNTLAAGGALELITDGGSTNAVKAVLIIEITQS